MTTRKQAAKTTYISESTRRHPLFQEAYQFAREFNILVEGANLSPEQITQIFQNAEAVRDEAGTNTKFLGKLGNAAGWVGKQKIGRAHV